MRAPIIRLVLMAPVAVLFACVGSAPRSLDELAVVDSLYIEVETGEPYSGPVFQSFQGSPEQKRLTGELREGRWEGELVVYHPNGRIRYMGSFVDGQQCGPWTENADSLPRNSVYDELVQEVESMNLYPPCDGSL